MFGSVSMIELVYVSHAKVHFGHQDLVKLLETARAHNAENKITGMLLYDGYEAFIQAIEGAKDQVEALFQTISQDPRHERISVLWRNDIEKRNFPDWQMGFKDIRELSVQELEGYSDFMQNRNVNTHTTNNISFAKELLRRFKQNNN